MCSPESVGERDFILLSSRQVGKSQTTYGAKGSMPSEPMMAQQDLKEKEQFPEDYEIRLWILLERRFPIRLLLCCSRNKSCLR